jgi:uncharacterized protein YbjT (DUF2867 family)
MFDTTQAQIDAHMIAVTGATGSIGRYLVPALLAAGAEVRALVHSEDSARALREQGVEVVIGSFEDTASLDRVLAGCERLFLLSPPGTDMMVAQQLRAVDRARAAGVRHIVKQSSIAADEPTDVRIIAAHRRIEEHIEQSGTGWTHLRSNWFMQNELAQAATIASDGVFYAPDVNRVSMIDARDIAAVAARVLTTDGHDGYAYDLTGPESLSYADVAKRLSSRLDRSVRWEQVTLEQARNSMIASGLPDELAAGFTEILARYRQGGVTAQPSSAVADLLGRDPTSFARFVADHSETFAGPTASPTSAEREPARSRSRGGAPGATRADRPAARPHDARTASR